MTDSCRFILRLIFLTFFAVNAWNLLNNLDTIHEPFAEQYKVIHGELEKNASFKIPDQLHYSNITQNSKLVVQCLLWTQLFLIGVSVFVMSSTTIIVALNHLIVVSISTNIWNIKGVSDLIQKESFLIALALFAASFTLGDSGRKYNRRPTGSSE